MLYNILVINNVHSHIQLLILRKSTCKFLITVTAEFAGIASAELLQMPTYHPVQHILK
jgi:hypothetical protein